MKSRRHSNNYNHRLGGLRARARRSMASQKRSHTQMSAPSDGTTAAFTGMHVLATNQFDEPMLRLLFETASAMKRMVATSGKSDLLRGRILANVFFEPSTRTMCSFDAAMKRLGGDVISVAESTSSAKKGETIEDTVRCLQCYCDVLVLRHPVVGTAARAAAAASKPVINAGDGVGEHPSQALLDLYTIVAAHPRATLAEGGASVPLDGLTLALVGDLKHGRTVHSLAHLVARLERPPRLHFVSPEALRMPPTICEALAQRSVNVQTGTLHHVLHSARRASHPLASWCACEVMQLHMRARLHVLALRGRCCRARATNATAEHWHGDSWSSPLSIPRQHSRCATTPPPPPTTVDAGESLADALPSADVLYVTRVQKEVRSSGGSGGSVP